MNKKKGFTLAELLIVVAIIAVLVGIAFPVFTAQLEKSREATDLANIRSVYAEVTSDYLTTNAAVSKTVELSQKTAGWETSPVPTIGNVDISTTVTGLGDVTIAADSSGVVTITQ